MRPAGVCGRNGKSCWKRLGAGGVRSRAEVFGLVKCKLFKETLPRGLLDVGDAEAGFSSPSALVPVLSPPLL